MNALYRQHIVTERLYSWAVSDEDDGLGFVGQDILQQADFSLRVEGGSSLIKEHDRPVAQQRTGDGNALRLTLGETAALFATHRIETIREFEDKISATVMQSFTHIVVSGIETT